MLKSKIHAMYEQPADPKVKEALDQQKERGTEER